jgi:hypothetical protein
MLPDFTKKPSFVAYKDWVATAGVYCLSGPIQFSNEVQLNNGTARISFSGTAGASYSIEASTNLLNWSPVVRNLSGTGSTFSFDDVSGTNSSRRFYRVLSP